MVLRIKCLIGIGFSGGLVIWKNKRFGGFVLIWTWLLFRSIYLGDGGDLVICVCCVLFRTPRFEKASKSQSSSIK